MNYEDRDIYGRYKNNSGGGLGPDLMGANTLVGKDIFDHKDEDLGDIKELMLDMHH